MKIRGLTVRIVHSDAGWGWELYDVDAKRIGKSPLPFPEKVDCFLNYAAHCAMSEAEVFIDDQCS